MRKQTIGQVKKMGSEFLNNYFSKENMNFFNTEKSEVLIYNHKDKYYILDNMQYIDHNNGYTGERTYCVKVYDVTTNKCISLVDHNSDKELVYTQFKEILKSNKD